MTLEQKQQFRTKIEKKIRQVKDDIVQLEELTKPIAPENAIGRISRMEALNSKSVNEAALRNSKDTLMNLESTIAKIDDPDLESCARCKQPIPFPRLLLMPESRRCVNCADKI